PPCRNLRKDREGHSEPLHDRLRADKSRVRRKGAASECDRKFAGRKEIRGQDSNALLRVTKNELEISGRATIMALFGSRGKRSRTLLIAEFLFLIVGFVCLGWAGYMTGQRMLYSSWQDYRFEQA